MKLLIDIPEEVYEDFQDAKCIGESNYNNHLVAIYFGIKKSILITDENDLISRKSASEAILKMTNRPSVKENPDTVNGLMGAYNIINGISHIKMK